ncbi:MAG: DUF3662 domain-containing protein [Chloroflexi bacterium]|nr:DUF3662 domain-containing protein [Chloroflexota bacterium]
MNNHRVTRLETHLERLIEGAFSQLFGKALRPHDIAVHLSRALEGSVMPSNDSDPRPLAPDHFLIRLNQDVYDHLLIHQPRLVDILTQHMFALASAAGCRLRSNPVVIVLGDENLNPAGIAVVAKHQTDVQSTTQVLSSARLERELSRMPINPVLVIDGEMTVALVKAVSNVGRGRDNEIVLSDPFVSRHHAQIRLRHGAFFVFDANSQGGIKVNDVAVREHRLQPGDVIRIGKTRLLYLEDSPPGEEHTEMLPPSPSSGS